jgi:uncharacterized UBP type Zn finger protein
MNEVNVDETNNNISEEEKENLYEEKMNYELTGILVHSGSSLQSGHYYSFIKIKNLISGINLMIVL